MNIEFQVGDYLFTNKIDADKAKEEMEKIKKLEEKIPSASPEVLYKLYNKCIETRAFVTPIGYEFMKQLKKKLELYPEFKDNLLPIPLYAYFEKSTIADYNMNKRKREEKELQKHLEKQNEKKDYLKISLIANLVLVLVVIAMFIITMNSDAPNIINYKTKIIDRYSEWQQELDAKEKELKARENEVNRKIKEMGIVIE
ncbi:MAG: hypothetical protein PUE21_05980 [Lachnospiraceae bacterium]|nr:hypothetical protein [Lachnospiraceae bacterium]